MIPNSANKIVNTTVDITQYINTEYFSVNNGVAYLIKIGKLRMIKVDITLKKAITKDTYVFNFPSNFLKGMINTYFFGNIINRNGKAYEVAFYNQLSSNNFSILVQVTAGNTIENNSRLIGEWTGFCYADINDISEEENQFITYNQFNTLISETLKDYTKNMVLEESQTQQDELIQKLQNNMIQESTEEATSLHLEDASDLPAVLNIRGNHYQEVQEGTDNLAVLNEGSVTRDGMTINIKDGVATMSGSNTSDATNYVIVGTAYLYAGQTYYMKAERNQTSGSSGLSIKFGSTVKWFTVGQEIAFECTQTGEYEVRVSFGVSAATNSGTFKLLISKTSGATWVQGKKSIPSVEYPSEIETVKDNIKIIQCNKNRLNVPSKNIGGVDLTLQEDGKYKINGNATSSWTFREGEKTLLEKGDYTLSVEVESGTFNGFFGIRGSDNIKYETRGEVHISLTEDKIITCYFTCSGTATFDNVVVKVQLEKSKVKTEWVKHEEKVHNLAVQQEMLQNDKFDLLKNKKIHIWKKIVLNGTENWQQSSTVSSVFYLNMQDTTQDKTKFELISNQYLFKEILENSVTSAEHNKIYGFISEGILRQRILLRNDNFTTLDSFKASLAEKNMTLYYVSDTTTELDLTEEQKQVLNELNALELFKGVNNIYTEQDLALLQLNYTADTKMYIDNKINSILGGN